jgi:photosynthetic reaction center cytochrome c subunit
MVELNNPRDVPKQLAANAVPEVIPAIADGGPPASSVYKNVQVLGGISVGEFTRTMVSITNWVSPKEGCNYCHVAGEGFEADTLYTKVVARKMLQMTQAINVDNKAHVGATGVNIFPRISGSRRRLPRQLHAWWEVMGCRTRSPKMLVSARCLPMD